MQMPTYLYECSKCGKEFEIFQSITEPPLLCCPEECCAMKPWAKGEVKRIISGGMGLLFKGSGFYITDYRSPSYMKAAKAETEASTTTKTTGDNSSASNSTSAKPKAGME
jgi:putative FmdB family regulatory protein